MANIIIIAVLAVIIILAIAPTVRHFRGEGACCGGGGGTVRERKELDSPKIGEKRMRIEGMHCDNCRNRVERAVNRLDGASCRVDLKRKLAVVSYSREITDEELKKAVEDAGYTVVTIEA